MTNSILLQNKIDASGLKIGYIAQYIGISRQLLWKKIKNIRPFDQYEIEKMCDVLKIETLEEKESIFFA